MLDRHIDDGQTNGGNSNGNEKKAENDEAANDDENGSIPYHKRPVSMFEHTSKLPQIPDTRPTNSMYQIIDAKTNNGIATPIALPRTELVKYLTDTVTRRIQELWTVMQEMMPNDAYVPCAERIRVAVANLTATFPAVSSQSTNSEFVSFEKKGEIMFFFRCSRLLMKPFGMPLLI